MSTPKIYLAGPIMLCSEDQCRWWREEAAKILDPWECLDPMRRKLDPLDLCNANQIVALDKYDIRSADAVLVNAWKTSVGTSMEILYAWEQKKLICTIVPLGAVISPWIMYHSTVVVPTVRDGCEWLICSLH